MKNIDYNAFAEDCVEKLKVLQESCNEQYDLNWYEKWFYNQSTGLLTFSTGDMELNFSYFDIGSYSPKSGTWKWSWDNANIIDKVKNQLDIIREFGQTSGFAKLTEGYFKSDEYDAWEFAAIAANLTNAIGVYRPVNKDGLQIFLVLTALVDKETADNIKSKFVQCDVHDYKRLAFVCQHLLHNNKVGFNEAFETCENMELGEDEDFQAWCDECEAVRIIEGEWNENSEKFANIKIVCEQCYFEIKEFNLGHR